MAIIEFEITVSNQLISLTSRESWLNAYKGLWTARNVSNQLISLTSREINLDKKT